MGRGFLLRYVNIVLLVFFVLQVCTVLFRDIIPVRLFFPVHAWIGRTLILIAAIHAAFNWNWVRANILKRQG